jgi:hypothetical protein
VAIALVGLALRLRDPLSSPIIGAEDPYTHMSRTWDLAQGKDFGGYPPGLMVLLLPFALLGPSAFYTVARFLPPLFGVSLVVGMFFLCRRYVHPAGALTASLLVAVMPETIRRTDQLFPTAMDLALLPWLFLAMLRASDGKTRALVPAGLIGVALAFSHPWALGLLAPPLFVFWTVVLWRQRPAWRIHLAFAAALVVAAVAWVLGSGSVSFFGMDRVAPRLVQLAAHPGSMFPLPQFVDLPGMLTAAALVLAAAGACVAVVRRSRFGLLALVWTALLLPLTLVDWFGQWYIPHRTVAYLGLGIAMLAALPVSQLFAMLAEARPRSQSSLTFGIVGVALLVTLPVGATAPAWYRIYGQDDYNAWHALDDRGTPYVEAGSWQARTGYRAMTGRDAVFNPDFFRSGVVRDFELEKHPHLVVLVDNYTAQAGIPTAFLEGWTPVGRWGTTAAYTRS